MREYFLNQIYGEYQSYKASVLEENGGSIYARCYEIDCMINIYEILKEFAMKLPINELERLMNHRDILKYLYELWLKRSDSHYQCGTEYGTADRYATPLLSGLCSGVLHKDQ